MVLHVELLPSLLPSEGAFSNVDCLIQENCSGGKPPDPQIALVFLGDRYSEHCFSGKELEDQNLPPWRNIHIHRCALRGRLAPCLGCAQASLVLGHVMTKVFDPRSEKPIHFFSFKFLANWRWRSCAATNLCLPPLSKCQLSSLVPTIKQCRLKFFLSVFL